MRILTCSLLGLLIAALSASAQGVAQPPAGPETLDTVLRSWERAMTELKSFACVVERDSLDKALQAKDKFKGYAMFLKATQKNDASRARLEMSKINNAKIFEKYICTGTFLYEYAPVNSVIRVHNMPQTKQDGVQQESFLSFLFGMGAEQAKTRYDMILVPRNPPDQFYHYLKIIPKLAQDKGDFAEARLTLLCANNLPRQIRYLQPNGNEIEWNFTEVQVNVNIPLKYFEPDQPQGLRVERVPAPIPAKATPTIRNSRP